MKRYRIANPSRFLRFILLLLLLVGAAAAVFFFVKPVRDKVEGYLYPLAYEDTIAQCSSEYGVDQSLICAVIKCESGFSPDAESSVGARGLMQLTEETFDWVRSRLDGDETFDDMYRPEVAIRYGTYLLSYLQKLFGTTPEVLAAYHAGMNQVQRWLDDPSYSSDGLTLDTIPFGDTGHYVDKVTGAIAKYQELYNLQ